MATVTAMLSRPWDAEVALRAYLRYQRRPTRRRMSTTVQRLLPLIGVVIQREWSDLPEPDREDLCSEALVGLLRSLPRWRPKDGVPSERQFVHYTLAIIRAACKRGYGRMLGDGRRKVEDPVWARSTVNDTHTYGDPYVTENCLFARDLPNVVQSDVLRDCRVPMTEHSALGYLVRQFVLGNEDRSGQHRVLVRHFHLGQDRATFLVPYAAIMARNALLRHRKDHEMFMADREGLTFELSEL